MGGRRDARSARQVVGGGKRGIQTHALACSSLVNNSCRLVLDSHMILYDPVMQMSKVGRVHMVIHKYLHALGLLELFVASNACEISRGVAAQDLGHGLCFGFKRRIPAASVLNAANFFVILCALKSSAAQRASSVAEA